MVIAKGFWKVIQFRPALVSADRKSFTEGSPLDVARRDRQRNVNGSMGCLSYGKIRSRSANHAQGIKLNPIGIHASVLSEALYGVGRGEDSLL